MYTRSQLIKAGVAGDLINRAKLLIVPDVFGGAEGVLGTALRGWRTSVSTSTFGAT